ncbi:zinc finger, CCHC-type containing protein [Tanacetum coccineum]
MESKFVALAAAELWGSLKAKYMAEDASSKKFLVSNFTNYNMTNSRPVMEQYNELLGIIGIFTQHKINMDEAVIYALSESPGAQDNDKPKGNNVAGPLVVNMVDHNNSSRYNDNMGKRKHQDTKANPNKKSKVTCWKCGKPGHLKKDCKGGKGGNKANGLGTNSLVDGSTNSLKGQIMFNKSLQVYYVTYVSEAYYVQDDDVAWWDDPKTFDKAMKSHDVAFWKKADNDEIDSIMGNNTWVLADLPRGCKPLGCKWIFKRKLKVDGTLEKFKARLVIQGFRQKSGIDYFDIYALVECISTIRLLIALASIHNLIIHQIDVRTTILNGELERVVSTLMDTSEKLMPNNCQAVSQFEYSRVIGCLMYAMTCTRPDIAFAVGKLSRYTSNPSTHHWQAIQRVLKYWKKTIDYSLTYTDHPSVLEGYTDARWISIIEENSSTSGWVILFGKGAIYWASKKQTCITISTIESEFVALAAAGKEAEWLRNLILDILLWSKPIEPISIRCDSAATLAKAYSQMYNGKSRHLGVGHSMIRELITNRVVFIEFVRSQRNLTDHLTKRLARDLVLKSTEGMGL